MFMLKKKVLITGSSGTVGRQVLQQLVENNQYLITIFDKPSKANKKFYEKYKGKIEIFFGDITNADDVLKISIDVDYVIHLAAVIPPLADEQPQLAQKVNFEGSKHLINALEHNSPAAFFIYASSISVYGDRMRNPYIKIGDPLQASLGDHYAETKIATEQLLQGSKLEWTIFRLTAIMGNHKISPLMFHMPLDTKIEICTPDDTARAFANALAHKNELQGRIFNLGGGEKCRLNYRQLLNKSFNIFGLGKLDFPQKTFAEKNFHCGYYLDGDELESILHFRREDLVAYFKSVQKKTNPFVVSLTKMLQPIIKRRLLRHSEPFKAFRDNNRELSERFFN